jgi:NSS family neurotransmitter:Na+ symporter
METIVSILMDKFKWKRRRTTVLVTIYCIAVGIPSSLGFGIWSGVKPLGMDILTFFDFISNSVLMPIMAFVTCIFAGYIMKPAAICEEVEQEGVKFRFRKFYSVMIRFVAPIGIIGILVSSVAASLGVFSW